MDFASECVLPKVVVKTESHKDFLFFKNKKKPQSNSLQFKFVGQKVNETNRVAEINLSSEVNKGSSKETNQIITRPRNCFIIMRSIFHNVIVRSLQKYEISSLQHVSAITSQLWGKNDGIFQLYFELLSQFEEHWHLNIYPEYRYHKVNKISRQLENKLVYQNMLDRMRYFTASSLIANLEDILILPPAHPPPSSSTYTYPALRRPAAAAAAKAQAQAQAQAQAANAQAANPAAPAPPATNAERNAKTKPAPGGKVSKQRIHPKKKPSPPPRLRRPASAVQQLACQTFKSPTWLNVEDLFVPNTSRS
ncbi:a2 transcriptional factor [Zygosaccharomyces rouxii]|uniref:A2 transcriptional factor n=1 Tax=Zygosaccharomyces rouxii TaxID=4956 RepID=A0A1Q3ADA5_ZYGRO|nr:a2 transcriptional factor [Zygosaccharomyces rouxii]